MLAYRKLFSKRNACKIDPLPRFNVVIQLLRDIKAKSLLDLGCGSGNLTLRIAQVIEANEVYGIDIDDEALRKAKIKGIKTIKVDLSKEYIPLPNESIDIVTALEVIEHLLNPDHMIKEAHRVLKKGGYFLVTTPNLASWINRIIMLLGYQPCNAEVSTEILAGVPWRAYSFTKPSRHIRPFTLRALIELLRYHGFKVVKVKGAPGVYPKHKVFQLLDKLFAKRSPLARRLIVLALKP